MTLAPTHVSKFVTFSDCQSLVVALLPHYFCTSSAQLLHYFCTTSVQLLHYFCTTSALLLATSALLLHCFCIIFALLMYYFDTNSALLLQYFCNTSALLVHFCTHAWRIYVYFPKSVLPKGYFPYMNFCEMILMKFLLPLVICVHLPSLLKKLLVAKVYFSKCNYPKCILV